MKTNKSKAKQTRNYILFVIICVLAVAGTFAVPKLIGILKSFNDVVRLKIVDSYITDTKTDIKYIPCGGALQAVNSSTAYGILDGERFYLIEFMEPEQDSYPRFLSDGEKVVVYRSEDTPEPDIQAFEAIAAQVCPVGSTRPIDYFVAPASYTGDNSEKDDYEYTKSVIDAFSDGVKADIPLTQNQSKAMIIRLLSKKYPGLYYNVLFIADNNGQYFLCDTGNSDCVRCPDNIALRIGG